MAIELTPVGGNPILNTVDEILLFARLDLSIVQDTEVVLANEFATDEVEFIAPEAETDRSTRTAPLRKRAAANLAASELWKRLSTFLGFSTPPKQILSTLNIQIGTDFPTQIDLLNAFGRVAKEYREEGLRILNMLKPITATIDAGTKIEDE